MSLVLDLHVHTKNGSPDSLIDPWELPGYIKEKGLDGIAITEHDNFSAEDILVSLDQPGLVLIAGIEIRTEVGDIIVFGLDEYSEELSSPKTIISPTSVLISIPAINTRPGWSKETRISSAEKLSCSVIAIPSRPFALIYPGNSHGSMRLSGEPFLVWTCRSRTRLIPLFPFKGCPHQEWLS